MKWHFFACDRNLENEVIPSNVLLPKDERIFKSYKFRLDENRFFHNLFNALQTTYFSKLKFAYLG
jgi:hypothetical protein